jgi:hypothetical protein
MSETQQAPERMWMRAFPYGGEQSHDKVEYVRADLYAALEQEVERLRAALEVAHDLRHALVVIRDSVPMDPRYLHLSRDAMLKHNELLAAIHNELLAAAARALAGPGKEGP